MKRKEKKEARQMSVAVVERDHVHEIIVLVGNKGREYDFSRREQGKRI